MHSKNITALVFSVLMIIVLLPGKMVTIVKPGFENGQISHAWKLALERRMDQSTIDSFGRVQRVLTKNEEEWHQLIAAKATKWNAFRDSLQRPFKLINIPDTLTVLLGFLGQDDAFTFGSSTVCLDITALNREYGIASLVENDNRIDRIFAHEYTHLLHKSWLRKSGLQVQNFRDSIWWECWYEGWGMFRSLNSKYLPVNGQLPIVSKDALEKLQPVFVDRLVKIERSHHLTIEEKEVLHRNLSRGPVEQKWGAFTVAIWLAMETKGDDDKLALWIEKGPPAIIELAHKYLSPPLRDQFIKTFH